MSGAYPGADYLISPATFPAYFLKDQARAPEAKCDLDLTLFGSAIAPALHITERFVGQEPTCAVTAQYNRRMQAILPAYGIHVTEIPRLSAISAHHSPCAPAGGRSRRRARAGPGNDL